MSLVHVIVIIIGATIFSLLTYCSYKAYRKHRLNTLKYYSITNFFIVIWCIFSSYPKNFETLSEMVITVVLLFFILAYWIKISDEMAEKKRLLLRIIPLEILTGIFLYYITIKKDYSIESDPFGEPTIVLSEFPTYHLFLAMIYYSSITYLYFSYKIMKNAPVAFKPATRRNIITILLFISTFTINILKGQGNIKLNGIIVLAYSIISILFTIIILKTPNFHYLNSFSLEKIILYNPQMELRSSIDFKVQTKTIDEKELIKIVEKVFLGILNNPIKRLFFKKNYFILRFTFPEPNTKKNTQKEQQYLLYVIGKNLSQSLKDLLRYSIKQIEKKVNAITKEVNKEEKQIVEEKTKKELEKQLNKILKETFYYVPNYIKEEQSAKKA